MRKARVAIMISTKMPPMIPPAIAPALLEEDDALEDDALGWLDCVADGLVDGEEEASAFAIASPPRSTSAAELSLK